MGNFVSVMTDEPALRSIVKSRDQAKLKEVLAACPQIQSDRQRDAKLTCLQRLIDGDFTAEEQDDGALFVYVFFDICQAYAQQKTTREIYVDEDMFPEIWTFVWGGGDTPFGLPFSPHGSPAVGYWDRTDLKKHIRIFEELDHTARSKTAGKNYADEINDLLDVLKIADEEGKSVYVFFSE
jgi:hypothetical protein